MYLSPTYSPTYLPTYLTTYLFTYLYYFTFIQLTYLPTHLFTYPLTYLSLNSKCNHKVYPKFNQNLAIKFNLNWTHEV